MKLFFYCRSRRSRHSQCVHLVLAVLMLACASRAFAQPAQPPTTQQLKDELTTGKPQEVIAGVAKLLAIKGDAAKAYDRYDLFCLRGEACLRTKTLPPAAEAFAAAQKETADPLKQAAARANEILIRKSRATGYQPKPAPHVAGTPTSKPSGPLPIIEEADRKVAMQALFTDELAAAQPRLKVAQAANSLAPVMEGARALADLGAIETAGTGASEQTKQVASTLGDHAHKLIKDALDNMGKQTEATWTAATRSNGNTNNIGNGGLATSNGMHGLTSVDQNQLREVITNCDKITPVATQLAQVTASDDLKADGEAAKKTSARAHEVLEYDYSGGGGLPRPTPPRHNNTNNQ